ncbi:MAG: hypothetical protein K2K39_02515 [Clostridia bacterium]|nr:hypothetical protein [Clostridia bacterium]
MSSYNKITKIKYTGDEGEIVSLDEYVMFDDEKSRRKYIVFKFLNNVTQQLLGMQFEVNQYDVDGNLIEKSQVVYNKFLAGAEQGFVPKAKLRVSYECASLSVKLIQAAFDRFIWKEGEYVDNSYKFDHFYHDEKLIDQLNNPDARKSDRKKAEKAVKSKPKKRSKYSFILRDRTHKNIAKFPRFFNGVIFLVLIAFVVLSVLVYKGTINIFHRAEVPADTVCACTAENINTAE